MTDSLTSPVVQSFIAGVVVSIVIALWRAIVPNPTDTAVAKIKALVSAIVLSGIAAVGAGHGWPGGKEFVLLWIAAFSTSQAGYNVAKRARQV